VGVAPKIAGISAQQWSETVRTDEQWEGMLFPRLLAVAERGWHMASWELPYTAGRRYKRGVTAHTDMLSLEREWASFARRVGRYELPRLAAAGWASWLPPPGARLREETATNDTAESVAAPPRVYALEARVEFPGLGIEYCLCAGNPHRGDHVASSIQIDGPDMDDDPDGGRFQRVGVGVSGPDGGAFVSKAREEAALTGAEPLGARPPCDAVWLPYDEAAPPKVSVEQGGPVTVWLRTLLGGRSSRAAALVAIH
jgi:hypothetical protein